MTRYVLADGARTARWHWLRGGQSVLFIIPESWDFDAHDLAGFAGPKSEPDVFLGVWHLEAEGRSPRIAKHLGVFGAYPGLVVGRGREQEVSGRVGAVMGVGEVQRKGITALASILSEETSGRRTVLGYGRAPVGIESFSHATEVLDRIAAARKSDPIASPADFRELLDSFGRHALVPIFVALVHDYNVRTLVAVGPTERLRDLIPADSEITSAETVNGLLDFAQLVLVE